MFSLRSLALVAALSATAYGAGTFRVINNCNVDLTAIRENGNVGRRDHGYLTLKAGGGTLPSFEHSTEFNGYMILHDKGRMGAETRIDTSLNKIFYDLWMDGESPIDGHFSLTPSDTSCPRTDSDQNLPVQVTPETSRLCDPASDVTLTFCD